MRAGEAADPGAAPRLALFVALAFLTRVPFLTVPFLDLDEAAALLGSTGQWPRWTVCGSGGGKSVSGGP